MKHFMISILLVLAIQRCVVGQVININAFTKIDPPAIYQYRSLLHKTAATSFTVEFSSTSLTTFPIEAQQAFNYATEVWSYLINTHNIPIHVMAIWDTLDPTQLIAATEVLQTMNFTNAPSLNVLYPTALAKSLAGMDPTPSQYDMTIRCSMKWKDSLYFGKDGNTPAGKIDFVSVIMHEIAHGLGIIHTFNVSEQKASWG